MSHPPPTPELIKPPTLSKQSRRDTNLTKFAREEYRKFIDWFPEDGFEIDLRFLPDGITAVQENALALLEKQGYIKLSFEHHGSEGFSYHVDLRGEKFLVAALCFTAASERSEHCNGMPPVHE
ncbi:hypothetical protein FACS189443_7140 [Planctomycetales bacterium]|nr:hypothetical protein FACS189443_7140 [Planctomycetales bacterium]